MKVLVIEDDNFFQHFYSTKLKEQGFEVAVAKNGNEGIQLVESFVPNLILLDIIMPEKNGFEVLEYLSKSQAFHNIPVIVFSTLGQENDVKKALSLGAKDYINKSFFDFDNLVSKINQYLK